MHFRRVWFSNMGCSWIYWISMLSLAALGRLEVTTSPVRAARPTSSSKQNDSTCRFWDMSQKIFSTEFHDTTVEVLYHVKPNAEGISLYISLTKTFYVVGIFNSGTSHGHPLILQGFFPRWFIHSLGSVVAMLLVPFSKSKFQDAFLLNSWITLW